MESTPKISAVVENTAADSLASAASERSERPRSLVLSVKSVNEVTGRHQRGFDGEGSEGT